MEAFSVYRIFFAIGVVSTIFASIALSEAPPYIFLGLVLLVQVLITGVSFNMGDLKDITKDSLISEDNQL